MKTGECKRSTLPSRARSTPKRRATAKWAIALKLKYDREILKTKLDVMLNRGASTKEINDYKLDFENEHHFPKTLDADPDGGGYNFYNSLV